MLNMGTRQILIIARRVSFGVYLKPADSRAEGRVSENQKPTTKTVEEKETKTGRTAALDEVLLPAKEVPEEAHIGDSLDVFLYKDSEDRPIATRRDPLIHLGETRRLTCSQITRAGAFMNWGLEKDVLLPYHEQTKKIKEGDTVLCALYLDKSKRLCVTMNVYPYLRTDSPYLKNMKVSGICYEDSDNFGMFVAVDDLYSALIPKKELTGNVQIGDEIQARVAAVKPDGKLELALREKAWIQMDKDAQVLLARMQQAGGVLLDDKGNLLTESAEPEVIRQTLQMSKSSFKRAIGKLLKEDKICLSKEKITLS